MKVNLYAKCNYLHNSELQKIYEIYFFKHIPPINRVGSDSFFKFCIFLVNLQHLVFPGGGPCKY